MLEKRNQGRPKQGETQVGRDRIISGFIEMVRSGAYGDISRKQIARHVGITPALITYYFPKGHFLLVDSFTGVFDAWYQRLDAVLCADDTYEERLLAAFSVVSDFHEQEYHVDLVYTELCRRGILGVSTIDRMKTRLADFIASDPVASRGATASPELMANIVWGACQHCARLQQSEMVYALLERIALQRPLSKRRTFKPLKAIDGASSKMLPVRSPSSETLRYATSHRPAINSINDQSSYPS